MPAIIRRKAPRGPGIDTRVLRRRAELMLSAIDASDAELSVLLTDDPHIRELNREHRKKDSPTDVLAFPMDGRDAGPGGTRLLGDVVVSLDTARRQARERRRDLLSEVTDLLAHGLLHLIGYDHRTDAEERRMNREAERLVSAAGALPRDRTKLLRRLRDRGLTPRAR